MDEDGVEVVHLDVSLEANLLFAAEGAARRGGKGVHPLPAAFQLRPGGSVLTVEVSSLPVGQEAGRQGLFLSREAVRASRWDSRAGRSAASPASVCWAVRAVTAASAAA